VPSRFDIRNCPVWAAAFLLLTAFNLVYGPDVGHGFVKDDFGWVARSQLSSLHNMAAVLTEAPSGFFRPVVSLSFGINRWICGLDPRCYGLTNLLLAIACAASIFRLGRSLSQPAAGALFASGVWAFNWHGIGMSVLWISGRTALMVVLFATLAATAFVRHHPWRAACLCLAAMLAKEEAILLPALLVGWDAVEMWLDKHDPVWRPVLCFSGLSTAFGGAYLVLRSRSGAFTPSTAPAFYRPSFTVSQLVENVPAYVDRSATFAAIVVAIYFLVCRPALRAISPSVWRVIRFGAFWWLGTLAVTVFLPVRSSLYACLPSVGVSLAASALVVGTWPTTSTFRQRRAIVVGVALPVVLWPILATRNKHAVREAELSSQTIAALRRSASELGVGSVVLLRDDRSRKPSLDNAFGTLIQDAADLMVRPPITVWIDPPPNDAALAGLTRPSHFDVVLTLRNGTIVPVP
jgi:hypothetical protein